MPWMSYLYMVATASIGLIPIWWLWRWWRDYNVQKSKKNHDLGKMDNLGYAMAWGYFFYLEEHVFPQLKGRINNFETEQGVKIAINRILILIPSSCLYELSEDAEHIECARNLESMKSNVAGVKDRTYKIAAVKLKSQRFGETRPYFLLEFASPLLTLGILKGAGKLTMDQVQLIRDQFSNILRYLLSLSESCVGKYYFIHYQDDGDGTINLKNELTSIFLNEDANIDCKKFDTPFDYSVKSLSNLGCGLANWYFYNYLKLIIPEMRNRLQAWEKPTTDQDAKLEEYLFILVPDSCHCLDLADECCNDKDITCKDIPALPKHTAHVGSSKSRQYEASVYRINCNKFIYCVMEFATPIRQLYKMLKDTNCILDTKKPNEVDSIRDDFCATLQELLQTCEHGSIIKIVQYKDRNEATLEKTQLSKVMKEVVHKLDNGSSHRNYEMPSTSQT